VQLTGALTLKLRARRSGADARIYTVSVACSDWAGNTTSTTVTVTVPHDSGGA
jgi:hypothetical protein